MKNIIKELENLNEVIATNQNADWSENDPAREFETLSYMVKAIIEKANGSIPSERQLKLDKLDEFVCAEDNEDLERMLDILENHEDPNYVTGWIDGIQMCEAFETSFTVKTLLQQIS